MGLMLSFTLAQDGDTSENDTKETARQMQTQLEIEEILCKQFYAYLTDLEKRETHCCLKIIRWKNYRNYIEREKHTQRK